MATQRLDVRLDQDRRRKLSELAEEQEVSRMSETVRRMIDDAYEEALRARRRLAAERIGRMAIGDLPDPATLSRQLEDAYEPGGLY